MLRVNGEYPSLLCCKRKISPEGCQKPSEIANHKEMYFQRTHYFQKNSLLRFSNTVKGTELRTRNNTNTASQFSCDKHLPLLRLTLFWADGKDNHTISPGIQTSRNLAPFIPRIWGHCPRTLSSHVGFRAHRLLGMLSQQ